MRVTAETKNATRARILDVAQKQFAQRGFEATTTRDIARAAQIAAGTLFNYFPTKESIVDCLVSETCVHVAEAYAAETHRRLTAVSVSRDADVLAADAQSLEEELFAHIAITLRKLKPYRKYLPAVLESSLSPLAIADDADKPSLRVTHLETVGQIAFRHGVQDALSTVAIQLYWTLYTGILAFWSNDRSPRQEDTLALVDQSLAMFVGWLTEQSPSQADNPQEESTRKRG
jgi:AcrR family transcriptional regulator